jgi:hypothetical protein
MLQPLLLQHDGGIPGPGEDKKGGGLGEIWDLSRTVQSNLLCLLAEPPGFSLNLDLL